MSLSRVWILRSGRCVEHAGGPLLVLAGPGTGKTTTLVETAVARVRAGVPVEHILMVTFSRRAAAEMRDAGDRPARTQPCASRSRAPCTPTRSACCGWPPAPTATRRRRLLAAAEQDVVIRDLLACDSGSGGRPRCARRCGPTASRPQLRDLLMRAIERGLDARQLHELGVRRGRPDWVAAAAFLREYQAVTVLRDPAATTRPS